MKMITLLLVHLSLLGFVICENLSGIQMYKEEKKLNWASIANERDGKNFAFFTSPSESYSGRSRPGVPLVRRPKSVVPKLSSIILPQPLHQSTVDNLNEVSQSNDIGVEKRPKAKQLNLSPTKPFTTVFSKRIGEPDKSRFQKRALDLIYHRFVEPRIHKHIESRPSLIEELIQTFENHIQKDLEAWSKATEMDQKLSKSKSPTSSSSDEIANTITFDSSNNVDEISSIAQVETGEDEDTFIVTDEAGSTHVVSVDEIINSLAQMNEAEISQLLLGTPIEPIERSSNALGLNEFSEEGRSVGISFPDNGFSRKSPFNIVRGELISKVNNNNNQNNAGQAYYVENTNVNYKNIVPQQKRIPQPVPVRRPLRKTIQKPPVQAPQRPNNSNQLILVQGEDGDMRLVTQKDLALSKIASEKKIKKQTPSIESTSITADDISSLGISSISLNNPQQIKLPKPIRSKNKKNAVIDLTSILQQHQQIPQLIEQNQHSSNSNALNSVRQALFEAREQQNKNSKQTQSSIFDLNSFIRPNTQPTPAPSQNNAPIRSSLAAFFSGLMGQNNKQQPPPQDNQYVKVLVPRNTRNNNKNVIHLPKPIHFETRQTRSTSQPAKRKSLPQLDQLFRIGKQSIQERIDEHAVEKQSSSSSRANRATVDYSTAEAVLKSAQIPESVRQKLLSQIDDRPKFVVPGSSRVIEGTPHVLEDGQEQEIDRLFKKIKEPKGKKRKKNKHPTGYEYILPPPEYVQPHYPPHGYGHQQTYYSDDQPLVDINLLADVVYLSKLGEENESFSFPKVGDASKFVDISRHY